MKAKLIFTQPSSFEVAQAAARKVGLSDDSIILLQSSDPAPRGITQMEDLIRTELGNPSCFRERRLAKGEAKTKLAFLSFSSGTTGRPKAVAIPHYALISNVVQIARFNRKDGTGASRFGPGQVSLGGTHVPSVLGRYRLAHPSPPVLPHICTVFVTRG